MISTAEQPTTTPPQSQQVDSGDYVGLAAADCEIAVGDSWLAGGATTTGRTTLLTLTNPTACAVTGVVLRESLGGLEPIEGSVRVKGVQLDAGISADVLEVTGLSLPALGSVRVTYLANVPLLSAARPSAQALLSGTDVTVGVTPKPPSTGCQCDSTSGVAFGLLALGAAAVRSRRRSR